MTSQVTQSQSSSLNPVTVKEMFNSDLEMLPRTKLVIKDTQLYPNSPDRQRINLLKCAYWDSITKLLVTGEQDHNILELCQRLRISSLSIPPFDNNGYSVAVLPTRMGIMIYCPKDRDLLAARGRDQKTPLLQPGQQLEQMYVGSPIVENGVSLSSVIGWKASGNHVLLMCEYIIASFHAAFGCLFGSNETFNAKRLLMAEYRGYEIGFVTQIARFICHSRHVQNDDLIIPPSHQALHYAGEAMTLWSIITRPVMFDCDETFAEYTFWSQVYCGAKKSSQTDIITLQTNPESHVVYCIEGPDEVGIKTRQLRGGGFRVPMGSRGNSRLLDAFVMAPSEAVEG